MQNPEPTPGFFMRLSSTFPNETTPPTYWRLDRQLNRASDEFTNRNPFLPGQKSSPKSVTSVQRHWSFLQSVRRQSLPLKNHARKN
jgi:hypothetical protein